MKWLKSLIFCLLLVTSAAQIALAVSEAELDQLMIEFENYVLHYNDLIGELEGQLQQAEKLFQNQNPGFGVWLGGARVELDWRDNAAGSVSAGNPRFLAEMAMRARLSSSFNSNFTITLYQNPYGGTPSTAISRQSLDGAINIGQNRVGFSAGDMDLYFTPLTMGRNRRILDESVDFSSWRFQGVKLDTKFRSIGLIPWVARTRRGVGINYDQFLLGLRSTISLTSNTNAQFLYYQLADDLRTGPQANTSVRSSLLGIAFQSNFRSSLITGRLNGELNWSFYDNNIFAAPDPLRDQAILLNSTFATSLGNLKLPLVVRYLAIGPNYPCSRTAGTGYTAVVNLPDDYIYQPEDDPYQYDYYRNRAGWRIGVGPVSLGSLYLSYLYEDYQELLPLTAGFAERSFLRERGEVTWNLKNFLGAETKLLYWNGNYSTTRNPSSEDLGIDVSVGDVGYGFWRKLSSRTQVQLTHEMYPKVGHFADDTYQVQVTTERFRIWHNLDKLNISGDLRYTRHQGIADSFALIKGRIELTSPLGGSNLQLIGEFERMNGEQMLEPSWSTRIFVKNSFSF